MGKSTFFDSEQLMDVYALMTENIQMAELSPIH